MNIYVSYFFLHDTSSSVTQNLPGRPHGRREDRFRLLLLGEGKEREDSLSPRELAFLQPTFNLIPLPNAGGLLRTLGFAVGIDWRIGTELLFIDK